MVEPKVRARIRPVQRPEPPAQPEPIDVRYSVYAGQRAGPLATILCSGRSEAEAREAANSQWDAGAGRVRIVVEHSYVLAEKVRK